MIQHPIQEGCVQRTTIHADRIRPLCEHSADEAGLITGRDSPEDMAEFLLKFGLRAAVIKLGKEGAFYMEAGGSSGYVPSYKVDLVDATGAGDAFCAGFLSRFIEGASVEECCQWGNAC